MMSACIGLISGISAFSKPVNWFLIWMAQFLGILGLNIRFQIFYAGDGVCEKWLLSPI